MSPQQQEELRAALTAARREKERQAAEQVRGRRAGAVLLGRLLRAAVVASRGHFFACVWRPRGCVRATGAGASGGGDVSMVSLRAPGTCCFMQTLGTRSSWVLPQLAEATLSLQCTAVGPQAQRQSPAVAWRTSHAQVLRHKPSACHTHSLASKWLYCLSADRRSVSSAHWRARATPCAWPSTAPSRRTARQKR